MGDTATTVYIIGYDGDRWLPDCVATLRKASTKRVSLVLIDNYKNPGLEQLDLNGFDVRVVKTPRRMGFADAHNFGVVAAPPHTSTAVMLNQDTLSRPSWLDDCVRCFEDDPQLGALSPSIRTYDWQEWDAAFLTCASDSNQFDPQHLESDRDSKPYYVPVITGAAMMVRTEAMIAHGLFDPIFGSYYEDYDFCRRLARNSWRNAICPTAFIGHFSGSATSTPEAEQRRKRLIQRNRVIEALRLASPNRSAALLRHLLTKLPRNLARGLMRTPSSQPVSVTMGAHWDLLRLLPRVLNTQRDEQAFDGYLKSIDWPSHANSSSSS